MSILRLPTLLDPRFKALELLSPAKADEAVQRLTAEYMFIVSTQTPPSPLSTQLPTAGEDEGPTTSTGMFSAAIYDGISHLITVFYFFSQVISVAI